MSTDFEPIQVSLTKDQIGDLIYQQLEDDAGDANDVHARHAIDFAVKVLDSLGLLVRTARLASDEDRRTP